MSQPKSSTPLIGITVAAMAVVFATSLFLGALYLRSRINSTSTDPTTGPTTANTNIEGKNVQYTIYPDEAVILLTTDGQPILPGQGGGGDDPAPPTAVPPTAIPPTPIPPTPAPEIIFTSYAVQNGDTLYGIAEKFGWTSTISLMAKYNIAADHIVPGNTLSPFPVANPAFCPGYRPYVVEESESAYTISQITGTTVETLKEINKLDDKYTVYVTSVICVP